MIDQSKNHDESTQSNINIVTPVVYRDLQEFTKIKNDNVNSEFNYLFVLLVKSNCVKSVSLLLSWLTIYRSFLLPSVESSRNSQLRTESEACVLMTLTRVLRAHPTSSGLWGNPTFSQSVIRLFLIRYGQSVRLVTSEGTTVMVCMSVSHSFACIHALEPA